MHGRRKNNFTANEHTRRTPPPYGPESSYLFATRFSLNSKFKNVEERFLRVKISARDFELIFVFLF